MHYKYNHCQKYIFQKCNFCLGDFLDKNEKTKVIIKTASKKNWQPCCEHLLSEKDKKPIADALSKEIVDLAKYSDGSYYDAPWPNHICKIVIKKNCSTPSLILNWFQFYSSLPDGTCSWI